MENGKRSRPSPDRDGEQAEKRVKPGSSGRRAVRPTAAELVDFVKTRGDDVEKSAPGTQVIQLVSNYFPMNDRDALTLYRYPIVYETKPPGLELRTYEKRKLFGDYERRFGVILGGDVLYSCRELPTDAPTQFVRELPNTMNRVRVTIGSAAEIPPLDPNRIQIYNIVMKRCVRELGLIQVGRNYFDSREVVPFQFRLANLKIWTGYKTSVREHERSLMLGVDMTNKVIREDTVLDFLREHRGNQEKINELLGQTVVTHYNNDIVTPYRIGSINFDENPETRTFDHPSQGILTLKDYTVGRYGVTVKYPTQPVLYARPKRADIRRGTAIALIPEFCFMTGLTVEQRNNFQLMRELNKKLQLNPTERAGAIGAFSQKIQSSNVHQNVLQPMGLTLANNMIHVPGKQLNPETVVFGKRNVPSGPSETWELGQGERYDWMRSEQTAPMVQVEDLQRWVVVAAEGTKIEQFLNQVIDVAKRMSFNISRGYESIIIPRSFSTKFGYMKALEKVSDRYGSRIQMLVVFLPNKDEDLYASIKSKCFYDYGFHCQCIQDKHCQPRGAPISVAVKVAIQMSAKLGGIPWELRIPIKGTMVIGFNISQAGRGLGSDNRPSVGALVATTNSSLTQFYSTVVPTGRDNLSEYMGAKMALILDAYQQKNDALPKRILFYRDGVGEGQLQNVVDREIAAMKKSLETVYPPGTLPQFTFIVVNKRVHTKFFVPGNWDHSTKMRKYNNPGPGTCVDDVVTLPERYDFYLVSQTGTGQGTVSPSSYNVIHNEEGKNGLEVLAPQRLQLLTYKLCHLYYNWSSTVAVPAVCQYAHKLAFLHNLVKIHGVHGPHAEAQANLRHFLYYL